MDSFYCLFFNKFQLTGCVVLGFSIYALVDGQTVSNLVEEGAEDLGESISVDIYKSSAIILIIASSIIVITSFLGCCGAIKVRLSTFIYNMFVLDDFLKET